MLVDNKMYKSKNAVSFANQFFKTTKNESILNGEENAGSLFLHVPIADNKRVPLNAIVNILNQVSI